MGDGARIFLVLLFRAPSPNLSQGSVPESCSSPAIDNPLRQIKARSGRWPMLAFFPQHSIPEEAMSKGRRTTHRSSTGTKLYAVRDAKGRFTDIQTYKRAHGADLKRKAKDEVGAR